MAARRVVLVIILCLFRPGYILNHTHTSRFDDGSLPPRRVSTGSNRVPFPLLYLLRSLVTPRFHRDLSLIVPETYDV